MIKEYTYLSFCLDDERLVSLSTEVEPVIILWAIEEGKIDILAYYKLHTDSPIYEVMFCPSNNTMMSILGKDEFKILKFQDEQIRVSVASVMYKSTKPKNMICHIWQLQPSIECIIVCEDGHIFFVNDKGSCTSILQDSKIISTPTCMARFTAGFFIGDGLKIHIYKHNNDIGEYEFSETLQLFGGIGEIGAEYGDDLKENYIKTLHIDFDNEERLVAITDKRNIYTTDLIDDSDNLELIQRRGVFKLAVDPVHSDRITSMDLCHRKPYVATASIDRTVKVWDYERKELVYFYSFTEEVNAVAFHPSGFHIAVAFSDKVQLINLYLGKTDQPRREWKELPIKNCKCLKFSNGGGFLAASSGATLQQLLVYPFYSNNSLPSHILKGHSGDITAIAWEKHDLFLFSAGNSGLIFKWKLRDGSREDVIQIKGPRINDMALCSDENAIHYVVNDPKSLIVKDSSGNNHADSSPFYGTVAITNSKKMRFTGIRHQPGVPGNIVYYKSTATMSTDSMAAHDDRGIEKIVITHDDKFLISCGADGIIMIFTIRDKEAGVGRPMGEGFREYCNNILVTKQEIDDLSSQKENLESQKSDEQNSSAHNLDIGGRIDENIKSLNEELKRQEEGNSKKYRECEESKNQKQARKQTELEETKQEYEKQLKELEVWVTMKLTEKQETLKDLIRQTNEAKKIANEKFEEAKRMHEALVHKEDKNFENELLKERQAKQRLIDDIEEIREKNIRELELLKSEVQNEQDDLQEKYKEEVNNLRNMTIKLKNNALSHAKKEAKHKEAIENLQETKADLEKKARNLEDNVRKLKKDNDSLEVKLKEKNNKITNKEKNIYELKRRTQELENFKFVLDFKIKELKRDIVPREKEISRLKDKITEMDSSLKEFNANNNLLGLLVESLEKEQNNLTNYIAKQKQMLRSQKNNVRIFKNSLYDAIQHILNYEILKEKLLKLNNGRVRKAEINSDIFREYESQLKFLEKSVNEFKQDLDKDTKIHKDDGSIKMRANVDLIREITELREAIKKAQKTENPQNQIKRIMQKKGQEKGEDYTENTIIEKSKIIADQQFEIEKLTKDLRILENIYHEEPMEI